MDPSASRYSSEQRSTSLPLCRCPVSPLATPPQAVHSPSPRPRPLALHILCGEMTYNAPANRVIQQGNSRNKTRHRQNRHQFSALCTLDARVSAAPYTWGAGGHHVWLLLLVWTVSFYWHILLHSCPTSAFRLPRHCCHATHRTVTVFPKNTPSVTCHD